jgi:hypothetical protein
MEKILFVTFMAYVLLSCTKEVAIKDQTVFENVPACVFDSTKQDPAVIRTLMSDRFDLIDVEGKLYSTANYFINIRLLEAHAAKVPSDRFPVFEKRGGIILACNMPKELSNKDFDGVRVKLSCRLFYEALPLPGRSLVAQGGYGVELLRIELLE